MGIIFQRPIRLSVPKPVQVPSMPKPTQFEGESRKEYRKRLLDWMIDREENHG